MLAQHKLWEDLILLSLLANVEWTLHEEEMGNVSVLSCASQQICCWRWAVLVASRTFGTEGLVRWCWLSLLLHLAVKKHSIKEQYMDYCPSMCLLQYQRMLFSVCSWEWMLLYISQCRKSWSCAPESGAKAVVNLTKPEYLLLSWTSADLRDWFHWLSPQAIPSQTHQQPVSAKLPQGRWMLHKYVILHPHCLVWEDGS